MTRLLRSPAAWALALIIAAGAVEGYSAGVWSYFREAIL
mgnify:CR=1 FL=1